jgi:hypothetical protein
MSNQCDIDALPKSSTTKIWQFVAKLSMPQNFLKQLILLNKTFIFVGILIAEPAGWPLARPQRFTPIASIFTWLASRAQTGCIGSGYIQS